VRDWHWPWNAPSAGGPSPAHVGAGTGETGTGETGTGETGTGETRTGETGTGETGTGRAVGAPLPGGGCLCRSAV